jgi:6-phosphogluconolactonase
MKFLSPQFEIHPNPPALFRAAAEKFAQIANDAVMKRGVFFVALAGGNTPRDLYLLLAHENWRARVPWQQTNIFFGDERCVPPDHPDNNYRMAREALLDQLSLPERNIHRMRGEDDPHAAAAAYEKEIFDVFGAAGIKKPCFDLILLGLGNDGHTASLFPETPALREKEKLVTANYVEKFKSYRLTMTLPLLNASLNVLFLVSGEGKAAIIDEIFKNSTRSFQYPAELVQPHVGKLLWLLDRTAAAALQSSAG